MSDSMERYVISVDVTTWNDETWIDLTVSQRDEAMRKSSHGVNIRYKSSDADLSWDMRLARAISTLMRTISHEGTPSCRALWDATSSECKVTTAAIDRVYSDLDIVKIMEK